MDAQIVNNAGNQPRPPPPPGGGVAVPTVNHQNTNSSQRDTNTFPNQFGNNPWNSRNNHFSNDSDPSRRGNNANNKKNGGPNDSGYNSWVSPNPALLNNNRNSAQTSSLNGQLGGSTTNNVEVVCNCGNAAVLLTVRKEGPNTGTFVNIALKYYTFLFGLEILLCVLYSLELV